MNDIVTNANNDNIMMTANDLDLIESGVIFAGGWMHVNANARLIKYRWVAVKGGGRDWAIYYGPLEWSDGGVAMHGDKVTKDLVIERLVPCGEGLFGRYRY